MRLRYIILAIAVVTSSLFANAGERGSWNSWRLKSKKNNLYNNVQQNKSRFKEPFYIGLLGGHASPEVHKFEGFPSNSSSTDTAGVIGVMAGKVLSSYFRTELELLYKQRILHRLVQPGDGGGSNRDVLLSTIAGFSNWYAKYPIEYYNYRVEPFIFVGFGFASNRTHSNTSVGVDGDVSFYGKVKHNFAYQFGLGTSVKMNYFTTLDLSYRRIFRGSFEALIDNSNGTKKLVGAKGKIKDHTVIAGIRIDV